MNWNLSEAKKRLPDLVNLALTEGPQTITRQGGAVVVISAETYADLTNRRPGFKNFLLNGPSLEGLDLNRDKSTTRDLDL